MKKRILRFEITDKCNQRCNMCWSLDWTHKDMDWEYIEKMIKLHEDIVLVILYNMPFSALKVAKKVCKAVSPAVLATIPKVKATAK
jgi:hypothetical protein